jgi:hypothetical protein
MEFKYVANLSIAETIVTIREVSRNSLERSFSIDFGASELGSASFDVWRYPSVSLLEDKVFVWSGHRIFQLSLTCSPLRLDIDEEITTFYCFSESIVLVCELSVRLLDRNLREQDRYLSDEALTRSWWSDRVLTIWRESGKLSLVVKSGRWSLA